MKLSQISEAKYYQSRISANRVANLYWNAFNSEQNNDDSFIRFHTPRLYGSVNRSATSTQIDAVLRAKDTSQATRFVKNFLRERNLPYTKLSADKIVNSDNPDDYIVTITFDGDD